MECRLTEREKQKEREIAFTISLPYDYNMQCWVKALTYYKHISEWKCKIINNLIFLKKKRVRNEKRESIKERPTTSVQDTQLGQCFGSLQTTPTAQASHGTSIQRND